MKRKLLCTGMSLITIFVLLTSTLFSSYAATEKDKQDLQDKIDQANNELNEISEDKEEAETELEKLTNQVTEAQNELAELKAQISELNSSIDDKQQEIEEEEAEIERKDNLLKARMVALYEAGDTTYLDVLFNSENLLDFLSNYSIIQQILETDTELLEELEKQKQQLENDKAVLEANKAEVEEVKAKQEIKSAELKTLQDKKQSEVNKLSAEEQAKQADIEAYNEAMVKVNQELEAAFKKAQEAMNNNTSSSGSAGIQFDGSFIWPCNNKYVTSTVKKRWGRMHKGIDIAANYESVYASASGYAYNAYDANGYGTYIMVFHGSGYVTLYGHLSSSRVSNGQYVKQGQVIGISGNSGSSQGAHLHFELRQATSVSEFFKKDPLDPLDYLPGGYTLAPGATTES